MNKDIKEIVKGYEFLTTKAERIKSERLEEVYTKIPEIRSIDQSLKTTSIGIIKAIKNKDDEQSKLITELRENNEILLKQKAHLLLENGYPKDYLEDVYQCKYCNDTGFIGRDRCKCFLQKISKSLHKKSFIEKKITKENFDTFNLDYFDNEKIDGISPKENILSIYEECYSFAQSLPSAYKNYIFCGNPGVGKTFMCNCIAKYCLDNGVVVIYLMADTLFKTLSDFRFNRGDESTNNEFYQQVYECDLLIIDDLGSEFITDLSRSEFFNLTNSRLISEKSTIISTNVPFATLYDLYSDRIVSRLIDSYNLRQFIGKDIRGVKKGIY